MPHLLFALMVLLAASNASAQVIFVPPPRPEPAGECQPPLKALRLTYALRGIPVHEHIYPTPLELGLDPQTLQPLFFRKADLLPQEPAQEPSEPRQADAVDPQKGKIHIEWGARGAGTAPSR